MRARARTVNLAEAPQQIRLYLGQLLITPGKVYDVHAVAVFEGITVLQIIDDLRYPSWKPAWLFETDDCTIPSDWICNTFHSEPSLIVGPNFVARDAESYRAMVEMEPIQTNSFWQRVNEHRAEHNDKENIDT